MNKQQQRTPYGHVLFICLPDLSFSQIGCAAIYQQSYEPFMLPPVSGQKKKRLVSRYHLCLPCVCWGGPAKTLDHRSLLPALVCGARPVKTLGPLNHYLLWVCTRKWMGGESPASYTTMSVWWHHLIGIKPRTFEQKANMLTTRPPGWPHSLLPTLGLLALSLCIEVTEWRIRSKQQNHKRQSSMMMSSSKWINFNTTWGQLDCSMSWSSPLGENYPSNATTCCGVGLISACPIPCTTALLFTWPNEGGLNSAVSITLQTVTGSCHHPLFQPYRGETPVKWMSCAW
jgi:hypothetical protein